MADFYPQSLRPDYARVTHILEATDSPEDKERLRKWQHKMDSLAEKKGSPTANEISLEAANRGTIFHQAIENYFIKGVEPSFQDPAQITRWKYAIPHLNRIKSNFLCLEQEVYSDKLKYIGHLDCIAWDETKLVIVDWKTSAKTKKRAWIENHFIQGAAYAIAAYECEVAPTLPEEIHIYLFSPERTQKFIEPLGKIGPFWIQRLRQFNALTGLQAKPLPLPLAIA